MCEQSIKILIADELFRELNPLEEWHIRPSTGAKGTDFKTSKNCG
jgi:hypothetical protein